MSVQAWPLNTAMRAESYYHITTTFKSSTLQFTEKGCTRLQERLSSKAIVFMWFHADLPDTAMR